MFQISNATKNNWKRLNLTQSEIEQKLSMRANKTFSIKNILPKEYFNNPQNRVIVQNFTEFLREEDFSLKEIIYNLGLNLLKREGLIDLKNNKIISQNKKLLRVLDEFCETIIIDDIVNYPLPNDEQDIIGIIYQTFMSEGNKNKKGSYYTPKYIVKELLKNIKSDTVFLDPCCGTGGFLLCASDIIKNPDNIYGIDLDEIACFISKINLIIKYKSYDFYPNIYNIDFLDKSSIKKVGKTFDFISTNPPWGAKNLRDKKYCFPEIKSKESFSMFIVQTEKFLNKNGNCSFVLPESILNVKTHSDIRKYILDNFSIEEIADLGKVFSGVLTDVVTIKLSKSDKQNSIRIIDKNGIKLLNKKIYLKNKNYNFNLIDNKDAELIEKIYSVPHTTLKDSLWGLGIVTGNNSKHILSQKIKGSEKIYTGKEIKPYILEESDKYIIFNRKYFQQTAPDEIYRADEKLVYKFISDKLVFAYDNKKSLFLNSANILIPKVETHSVKTVMAYLNSEMFQYLYRLNFGEIKILKGNLLTLPFPLLDNKTKTKLEKLVDKYIETQDEKIKTNIDEIVKQSFFK